VEEVGAGGRGRSAVVESSFSRYGFFFSCSEILGASGSPMGTTFSFGAPTEIVLSGHKGGFFFVYSLLVCDLV